MDLALEIPRLWKFRVSQQQLLKQTVKTYIFASIEVIAL